MRYRFLSIEWLTEYQAIMTVQEEWRSFPFFRKMSAVRRWRGSCTVWHDADTGQRAGDWTGAAGVERVLSDFWTRAKWKRDE